MRIIGFLSGAAAMAVLGMASGRAASNNAITITVGDTVDLYQAVRTDSVLRVGRNQVIGRRCGIGAIYFKTRRAGVILSADTVAVSVVGCAAPASTVYPNALLLYRDSAGLVIPFRNGDAGPIGETFCIYAVRQLPSGAIRTGERFTLHSSDPTILSVDQPACPDTTVDLTRLTGLRLSVPAFRAAE